MSEADRPAAESTAPPTAGENLRAGLSSPAAKLKLIVLATIGIGILGVVMLGSKKAPQTQEKKEVSQVSVSQVNLPEDDPGARAANREVDSLISEVEAERERTAISEGTTYVAPVPDLDAPGAPAPSGQGPRPTAAVTVSYASQQSKLAALQGLDERLSGIKSGSATEVVFQAPQSDPARGASSAVTPADTAPATSQKMPVPKQYPPGTTVWLATTLTKIDSEVPGPITARLEQGPFAGGTVLGSYEVTGRKYVAMTFTRLVFEGVERPINAIAVDPNNGLAAVEGDIDNHWGARLILPTLAAAVSKYAEAATFGGTTSISGGGTVIQQPQLSTSEKLQYALGSGVQAGVTPALQAEANAIKREIKLDANTSFGLMLVEGL